MDSKEVAAFVGGFITASLIATITFICFLPFPTEIAHELIDNVQQSTNIVEALKKERMIIRDVDWGRASDTVEIIVEYDFLYENSKRK